MIRCEDSIAQKRCVKSVRSFTVMRREKKNSLPDELISTLSELMI